MGVEVRRLEADDHRPDFCCGDDDLNEFFHVDSIEGCNQLVCVTYGFFNDGEIVGFFSLSNDAIKKELLTGSTIKRLLKKVPREKRYSSMPAVKIGRLGVCSDHKRLGYGQSILDFLKAWFTVGNKTGCRFIVVDAYNDVDVLAFYRAGGFQFLTSEDKKEKTRIMYFDLITFRG